MALDLSIIQLEDSPLDDEKKRVLPDSEQPNLLKVGKPAQAGKIDLSGITLEEPGAEKEEKAPFSAPKVKPLLQDLARRAARATEAVPGSTPLKYLEEMYGPKATPLKPVTEGMKTAKDFTVQAAGVFKLRQPFMYEQSIKLPGNDKRTLTPEQAAWERDVNAMVEIEAQDLAKNLAGKRHPSLEAAQSGQKQLQLVMDLGFIAAAAAGTGAVLTPVKELPKIAKFITQMPRLARLVEAGAIGIPYATSQEFRKVTQEDQTLKEAFSTYPEDVAKNVAGFMAFSAAGQLAGAAFDKVAYDRVVQTMPLKVITLTAEKVKDFLGSLEANPGMREFMNKAVPGFQELAKKTFKTGEETKVLIPEIMVTKMAAKPWYQAFRKALVSDAEPVMPRLFAQGKDVARTLVDVGGVPPPPAGQLPGPKGPLTMPPGGPGSTGAPASPIDLAKIQLEPAATAPSAGGTIAPFGSGEQGDPKDLIQFNEEANPIKEARKKGLDDLGLIAVRYTDERTGLLKSDFLGEARTKLPSYEHPDNEEKPLDEMPMLIADLDNFSKINNTYGHKMGNMVLKTVGDLAKKFADENGLIAVRDGGEEFKFIILNKQDPSDLAVKLDKVRDDLKRAKFIDETTGEVLFTGVNFSAGFGVNFERADKRLYDAKKAGKGRTTPIDIPELEKYNNLGGTKHELKRKEAAATDLERQGTPKEVPEGLPKPGSSGAGRADDREIRPSGKQPPAQEVKPPTPKTPADVTASHTPLLQDIVPQEKKLAGQSDIVQFVIKNGGIDPGKDSGDILELGDKRLIKKTGKSLDHMREAAAEAGYIPRDTSSQELIDLIDTQLKTGKRQFAVLGGAESIETRPVSNLSARELIQAEEDFNALKAKRPLTETEAEIYFEVQEIRERTGAAIKIDLSKLPLEEPPAPAAGEIPPDILKRLEAAALTFLRRHGSMPYDKILEGAKAGYLKEVQAGGPAAGLEMIEEAERVLDKGKNGDILEGEDPNARTEAAPIERGEEGSRPVGARGGDPLEGEPPAALPGFKEGGETPGSAPKRGQADRGGVPQGEGKAGKPGDGSGTGGNDRPGTGEGGVGLPSSGGGPASTRQRELNRKSALEKLSNYRITAADRIGEGTPEEKYQNNIAAIKLLKQLELEGRPPLPEEMPVLARYVGWGGMPQVFDDYNPKFKKKFTELEALLTPEEYEAARASTPNAHYTSPEVINSMYEAIKRMGFTDGRILEPAAGVGNFIGMMPESIILDSRITMVELDSISGRIAKALYSAEDVRIQGFETVKIPDNYFDLAISNVPFGNFPVHDPAYAKLGLARSIHNYFFAKSIDKVRPGGLLAFITSRYTMDAEDPRIRKYLSERADLVGAIRLPNTAFKKNAGTEVVTDIIFLQKRESWQTPKDASWVETTETKVGRESVEINSYFAKNPAMMLGKPAMSGTMYGDKEFTLEPTGDLPQQLTQAIAKLDANIYKAAAAARSAVREVSVPAPEFVKEGGLFVDGGKVYKKIGDTGEEFGGISVPHIQSFLKVRDQLRTTMGNQLMGNEALIPADQKALNKAYDNFVANYGPINAKKNEVFAPDPDYPMMLAIEKKNKDTGNYEKADIFSKRVLAPDLKVESVETSLESLFVSLNETGRLNFARMEALTGKSRADLIAELKGSIYKNPETSQYETVDQYLSGNVRRKLELAESAAKNDPDYKENVHALKEVQPKDLMPAQIKARLGSPWIPAEVVDQFAAELFNLPLESSITTTYIPQAATWAVDEGRNRWSLSDNVGNTKTWGTDRYPAVNLISDTLNHKLPTVYDRDAGEAVVNKAETEAARDKQEKIKEKFQAWVMADPKRATDLAAIYNRDLNNIVLRTYDGKHLTLPGANRLIFEKLRKHQKNGIFRSLQGKNVLLAHAVGAGKTWEMAGIAMESKRIGLFNKSVITVPKNRLKATAAEFLQMYPSANLLVADSQDLSEANRKVFKSRVATGDWDAIIISHDSFSRIRMGDATIQKFLDDKMAEFTHAIEAARGSGGKNMSVKELEKAKKRIEAKLKAMMKQEKKDEGLTFEELGIDQIIVDEAQNYKSLFLVTQMTRVKGIPTSAADRAFDMFMKTEYLNRVNNGKGIVFATGTPVTNTIAEIYIMQRYLQNEMLKSYGIDNFDAWAHTFGETVTGFELDTTGKGFRPVSRFSKFSNMPELLNIFFQVADVQTAKMLNLPVPKLKGGAPQPVISKPSPELLEYVQKLMKRAEDVRAGRVDKTDDNMLKISTDGRKAAMDMRLVDPTAKDYPGSKSNLLVDKLVDIFRANAKTRSIQLVFSDLGTPGTSGHFSVYDDIRKKLVAKGIPKEQIAFIHDAKTADARKLLEEKVNSGQIRILVGSTPKMGLGMNVQERIVALHNLDVPWRPDWLEQRNGRALRQGNLYHDEVQIYNYGTEKSFDAFMWQTVERKAKFISQVMSGEISAREVEDVDDVVLNFAQMKAITTGDPTILEKVELDAKIAKMQSLQTTFLNNQHMAHMEIAALPDKLKGLETTITEIEADLATISKYDPKNFKITLGSMEIDERVRAGEKIMLLARQHRVEGRVGQDFHIGEFKGLPLFIYPAGVTGNPDRIHVQGKAFKYEAFIGDSPDGLIKSLDYQSGLETLKKKLESYHEAKSTLEKKLKDLEQEVKKPFPDADKLKDMAARQQELEKKLDMSKGESTVGTAEEERAGASDPEDQPPARDSASVKQNGGGGGGAAMRPQGGAAARAPSTKPGPGGPPEGEAAGDGEVEQPKNPVWPGSPNDFIPHIEMPELVRFVRLLTGHIPTVKKLRRNLGYFKGQTGGPESSISLDIGIFKDPVEATKILAHEIGHLGDWLSNFHLDRGNILGRLKTLIGYRKTLIDPLPSANDALDPVDRRKLKNAAIKEALSHTDYTLANYIKNPEIRRAMWPLIRETYNQMVADEIKKKGLITKEQVMNELKAVTRYWHPFDPDKDAKYTAYRFSAKELYAEALSMLFNEPLRLKEMAPTFYKAFWDNLEKKPEVQFNLLELDELLGTEQGRKQILEQRSIDTREGYWKGEKIWYQKRMERSLRKRNFWLTLKDELVDRNAALIAKVKELQKQGKKLNPEDNPIYYLEEYNYLGGKIHNLLGDISKDVLEETARLGISQEDIGEYLERRRVVKERKEIANPLGQNIMTAQKSLEHLLSKFNDLQRSELEKAIQNFAGGFEKLFKEMYDVGLISAENYLKYKDNDAYATFAVVDYLSDYISAGIIHQVGTFKEIANPLTASIMKMISMKRAVEREKTRKMVHKFMMDNVPEEIKEAEYKFIGMKGDIPIREPREKEGFGILTIHVDGKAKHFYVDPYIADSVNYTPQQFNSAIIRALRWFNQGWFRPIYINLNLGFQSFNLIRDFMRGWKLNPDVSFAGQLLAYYRAAPSAYSAVWGKRPDQIIHDMREHGMSSITYNDMFKGAEGEDSQIEYLQKKYGLGPATGKEKRNPFIAVMDFISDLGNFIELLPKVAGAQTRIKAGRIPMRLITHEVQHYAGSPNFLRKGRGYTWYNEVFLFLNAAKEGFRGDFEGAFTNPRTRAGYWWKTTATVLVPALLAFLAAAGFAGKKMKEMYDRVTEYDKTSYIVIPMGMTDNDQVVYLRIPMDEVGRLIHGVFWKMLTGTDDVLEAAVQVAGLTAGQMPSQAPILDMVTTVSEYMIGRNPYDWFRGRQILTDDEQRVRGLPAAKKMGRWVLNKAGASVSWGYFDKPGDSTIVKIVRYAPVISRYIKVTDYGLEEKRRAKKGEKLERQAEKRIRRKDRRASRKDMVLVP